MKRGGRGGADSKPEDGAQAGGARSPPNPGLSAHQTHTLPQGTRIRTTDCQSTVRLQCNEILNTASNSLRKTINNPERGQLHLFYLQWRCAVTEACTKAPFMRTLLQRGGGADGMDYTGRHSSSEKNTSNTPLKGKGIPCSEVDKRIH